MLFWNKQKLLPYLLLYLHHLCIAFLPQKILTQTKQELTQTKQELNPKKIKEKQTEEELDECKKEKNQSKNVNIY